MLNERKINNNTEKKKEQKITYRRKAFEKLYEKIRVPIKGGWDKGICGGCCCKTDENEEKTRYKMDESEERALRALNHRCE